MAEIESDLWEHREANSAGGIPPADTGFEVLLRFVFGVPADLMWRRSVASSGRIARSPLPPVDVKGRTMMKRFMAGLGPVLVVLMGSLLLLNGVGILLGHEKEIGYGLIELGSGIGLLSGLFVTRYSPRAGTGIIIATVVVAAWMHFWTCELTIGCGTFGLRLRSVKSFRRNERVTWIMACE